MDTVITIKAVLPQFGPFWLQKQVEQEGRKLEKQPGVWGWEGIAAQLFPAASLVSWEWKEETEERLSFKKS